MWMGPIKAFWVYRLLMEVMDNCNCAIVLGQTKTRSPVCHLFAAEPIACCPHPPLLCLKKGIPGIKMARELGSHFLSIRAHIWRAEHTLTSSSLQGNSLKPTHFLESPRPTRNRAATVHLATNSCFLYCSSFPFWQGDFALNLLGKTWGYSQNKSFGNQWLSRKLTYKD